MRGRAPQGWQCGVDACVVHLVGDGLTMVNPAMVGRLPEDRMHVWDGFRLALPPLFRAIVLWDAWLDVQFRDAERRSRVVRLAGERAAQHEQDHDRGVLILNHVGLDKMETDLMRELERVGDDERMVLAYSRAVKTKQKEERSWLSSLSLSLHYDTLRYDASAQGL